MTQQIGFIGLGQMGVPMVANLLAAQFHVIGSDLREPVNPPWAKDAPYRFAPDAAAVAPNLDVLVLMLPNSQVVNALLWDKGLAALLKKGACVLDMSSSEPMASRDNAKKLAAMGLEFVDAPVSGGVRRAVDGSLAIMAGGEEKSVARVMPILQALGKQIVRVGDAGAGHAVKALNNYVSAAGLLAASEALAAAQRFGIDPKVANQVFNASSGKNNTTENKVEQFMLNGKFNSGFSMALMRKDLETALSLINSVGGKAEFATACVSQWQLADGALGKQADHTAMYQYTGG
jgi:3-hydroxyisobutyrate dehydrogenase